MAVRTEISDNGNEVVVFNDDLIELRSVKWKRTVWLFYKLRNVIQGVFD